MMLWVDSEVHLLPPDWCKPSYYPASMEKACIRAIYDHPEREQALSKGSVEGLLAEMETAHINKAVIMGLPWLEPSMNWENNSYISKVVQQYPDLFFGMGVISPQFQNHMRQEICQISDELGLNGIKVIPSWSGFRLDDSSFSPVLEEMIDHNLVLISHTDHAYLSHQDSDTVSSLYHVALRYPELKILAPHLGGLLCLYALHPPVKPALKNILFITSVPTTMQMICYAVDAIGPEQVAFGTDFPFNPSHDQRTQRQQLLDLPLDDESRRLIAGKNLLRFLDHDT